MIIQLSLFPKSDVITKEIESWSGYADSLSTEEERNLFKKMFNEGYKYSSAINAKGEPFPTEFSNNDPCYYHNKKDQLATIKLTILVLPISK